MISTSDIATGEATASSFGILTWQQMITAETASNIFPVVENVFQNKKEIFDTLNNNDNDIKFSYYEVHDGRMIYMLTQHSLFNRKHHPFLLCKCKTGDGVRNNSHICNQVTHDEQVFQFKRSKTKWETMSEKEKNYD